MKLRLTILLASIIFGNCQALINFKVPPFTITNAQTAAEKQMVGEDRELEKDGWLVSSIQSSSGSRQQNSQLASEIGQDPELLGHQKRLLYLESEVKRYKLHNMIGEGQAGILKFNPFASQSPFYPEYEFPAKRKRLDDVLRLVNESRKLVIDKQVEEEKKKGRKEEELRTLRLNLSEVYIKNVSKGEYYEISPGKWEKM
ncbi:hypothetical protein LPTSP4_20660 [Leptospira ryugenii]|uniref:Lipoprotein n=1 Tax=Leptospira ryugenii TaxID=1917863 RepID=A0A2P2E0Y6_9LEPT|nr:DUF1318 domain-containing protein [Leptospira ryugenii]GBF50540.1 hypothetical protein LPTSP4_20660 [Leptospira ryugenii]